MTQKQREGGGEDGRTAKTAESNSQPLQPVG